MSDFSDNISSGSKHNQDDIVHVTDNEQDSNLPSSNINSPSASISSIISKHARQLQIDTGFTLHQVDDAWIRQTDTP
ncbi:18062_t:CDS:1, partial [Acaulospora morrowiae]